MSLKSKWIVSRKSPLEAKKVSKPCNNTPQPPELSKPLFFYITHLWYSVIALENRLR